MMKNRDKKGFTKFKFKIKIRERYIKFNCHNYYYVNRLGSYRSRRMSKTVFGILRDIPMKGRFFDRIISMRTKSYEIKRWWSLRNEYISNFKMLGISSMVDFVNCKTKNKTIVMRWLSVVTGMDLHANLLNYCISRISKIDSDDLDASAYKTIKKADKRRI